MGVGSALMGFFGLVWRILEGVRRVLHLILLLVIFGFILAALHTSIPSVPHTAALVIAPEGEIVEQLASDPVRRFASSAPRASAWSRRPIRWIKPSTTWRRRPARSTSIRWGWCTSTASATT